MIMMSLVIVDIKILVSITSNARIAIVVVIRSLYCFRSRISGRFKV